MMGVARGAVVVLALCTALVGSLADVRPGAVEGQRGALAASGPEITAATTVKICLIAIGDEGKSGAKVGCGDSVVPVTRQVSATKTPLRAALNLLLGDHHRFYGQSGLYNSLYRSHLSLQRAAIVGGKATVQLRGTIQLGGVCDDPRVVTQLRRTVLQFRTERAASIFINGRPLARWLSEKG